MNSHIYLEESNTDLKIKKNLMISNILSINTTEEAIKINNTILRKKLLELTFSFLEPIHIFIEKNAKNSQDLCHFNVSSFLGTLKNSGFNILTYYNSLTDLERVYTTFFNTMNFKSYFSTYLKNNK